MTPNRQYFQAVYIGDKARQSLPEEGRLPGEHFSKKGSTAIDAKFDTTLMTDISRQSRNPLAIVSVGAVQCYDRANHVMLALMWIALLKNTVIVKVILECLQTIKFYQRSGYGDSTDYVGGPDQIVRWMGLGQGSRGASQGWVQTSSITINVLKRCGYGAEIVHPINKNKNTSVRGAL